MAKEKKKQYCKRGHDVFVTGRDKTGHCILCDQMIKLEYKQNHLEEIRAYKKEYNKLHYPEHKIYVQQYDKENHDQLIVSRRLRENECRDVINAKVRKYKRQRSLTDMQFKITNLLRLRQSHALKGVAKQSSAIRDLGCTVAEAKQYIESKFLPGMTWGNWGKVWQLDHIIPFCSLDLSIKENQLKVCHYTNLQPLTIEDHQQKTKEDFKNVFVSRRSL
jgi:hypothetical protein